MKEADTKLGTDGDSQKQDLMDRFQRASSYVSTSTSSLDVGVDTRLRLYGLFKIVTTNGQNPSGPPVPKKIPFWDFEGIAKLKSWQSVWEEFRINSLNHPSLKLSFSQSTPSTLEPTELLHLQIVHLAATEYIEQAKELGWTSDDDNINHLTGAQDTTDESHHHHQFFNEMKAEDQELFEILKKNYRQQTDQESHQSTDEESSTSINEVERDEYGIEITTIPPSKTDLSSSSSSVVTESFSKIGGPSVSKLTIQESDQHTTKPLQLETSYTVVATEKDNMISSSYLHDLILDSDLVHLRNYLAELHSTLDSASFYSILNGYHNGYTAFHIACDQGDLEKVKVLVEFQVDIHLTDRFDLLTGRQLASEAGMLHVVQFLSPN